MDWSTYSGNLKWLPTSTIFVTLHGSHAYGTNIPTSDVDLRGVCVPPRNYLLGMDRFEQVVQTEPDMQVFGLQKFFMLAAACNPNVLHPPCGLPLRSEFGLTGDRRVSKEQMGAFDALEKVDMPEELLTLILREKQYAAARLRWEQYQNWLAARNATRAALELKHGYDTKHAMHLVRLMRMAGEVMSTGRVIVKRPDAAELLAIRSGEWSYDQLIDWADKQDLLVRAISSPLVKSPDMARLSELCVEITEIAWRC